MNITGQSPPVHFWISVALWVIGLSAWAIGIYHRVRICVPGDPPDREIRQAGHRKKARQWTLVFLIVLCLFLVHLFVFVRP